MMKKRIVIAGLGDTGLLVAVNLPKEFEIIGISPKPGLVSGQELGNRLSRPHLWKNEYLITYKRFRQLDHVQILHGTITNIDTQSRQLTVLNMDQQTQMVSYDILVIASGVSNGFWRNPVLENISAVNASIDNAANRIAKAKSVAILGGGATGVSVASNVKEQYPEKEVHLFFSQAQALPGYHPKVKNTIEKTLLEQGVHLHPHHRAIIPTGFACDTYTTDPVAWQTGQAPFQAELTLWALGQLKPNNAFIPQAMLNDSGFVKADQYLRVPGFSDVFTVGDIADSDPNHSSARNSGFLTVAHNITCLLQAQNEKAAEAKMKKFKATKFRWGSILGVQNKGMRVFTPWGGSVLMPPWIVKNILFPLIVRKLIYKGIDNTDL